MSSAELPCYGIQWNLQACIWHSESCEGLPYIASENIVLVYDDYVFSLVVTYTLVVGHMHLRLVCSVTDSLVGPLLLMWGVVA